MVKITYLFIVGYEHRNHPKDTKHVWVSKTLLSLQIITALVQGIIYNIQKDLLMHKWIYNRGEDSDPVGFGCFLRVGSGSTFEVESGSESIPPESATLVILSK